jgi:hypothetical protein
LAFVSQDQPFGYSLISAFSFAQANSTIVLLMYNEHKVIAFPFLQQRKEATIHKPLKPDPSAPYSTRNVIHNGD